MFTRFDLLPKYADRSVRVKSVSGGVVSILMLVWVVFLLVGQISSVFSGKMESMIIIDNDPLARPQVVYIDFDVTVNASCPSLHIDHFPQEGLSSINIVPNIDRTRLDANGTSIEVAIDRKIRIQRQSDTQAGACGPCYGALPDGQCCNTCGDVVRAFRKQGWSLYGIDGWEQCTREGVTNFGPEKCGIKGTMKMRRGSGVFHIGLGENAQAEKSGHKHDVSGLHEGDSLSHKIAHFAVGKVRAPGFAPPLDNVEIGVDDRNGSWVLAYYVHIVPARHTTGTGSIVDAYRYTVMYSQRETSNVSGKFVPGIHFHYDFSPMMLASSVRRPSIHDLILHMAGIIGGAFSFAAIIDVITLSTLSRLDIKRSMGKDA